MVDILWRWWELTAEDFWKCLVDFWIKVNPQINYYCIGFQPHGFVMKPLKVTDAGSHRTVTSIPRTLTDSFWKVELISGNHIWIRKCQNGISWLRSFPNLLSCKKVFCLFLQYGVPSPFLTINLNSTHPANHPEVLPNHFAIILSFLFLIKLLQPLNKGSLSLSQKNVLLTSASLHSIFYHTSMQCSKISVWLC